MTGFLILLFHLGIGLFFNIFVVIWIIRKAYKEYTIDGPSMEGLIRSEFKNEGYILVYVQLLWPIAIPFIIGNYIIKFFTFLMKGFLPFLALLLSKSHKKNNPEEYV